MRKSSKVFVGMDVHKESIDVTVAQAAGEVRRWGQIGGGIGRRWRRRFAGSNRLVESCNLCTKRGRAGSGSSA